MKFINKLLFSLSVMIAILLVVPWGIVQFVNATSGMVMMLILMFLVNPVVSAFLGAWVCREAKRLWWIPVCFGILFMLCYWIALRSVIWDLYVYAVIYWVIGTAALLIGRGITSIMDARRQQK